MLVLLAPWVSPIVEDLAPEEVASDPPRMAITIGQHDLLAHFHGIEIDDLECDVIRLGLESRRHEQGMMVRRLVAAIQPHERTDRRAVRQAHDVGRKEAERVHVPTRAHVEVGRLEDEMSELRHLRRLQRGALRVIHPNVWFGELCGIGARVGVGWLRMKPCSTSTATPADRADGRRSLPRGVGRVDRTTGAPSTAFRGLPLSGPTIRTRAAARSGPIRPDRCRAATCSAHVELGFAFRGNDQAKVEKVLLGSLEIRTLKMNKQKFAGFDDRRRLRASSMLPGPR